MAETCCGRRAARVTMENIRQSLQDLGTSIESHGTGLEQDPGCECDPCMCPSDDVPCNARYLGNDLSDQGLRQALNRLVRHARQIQAAQGDACDCLDQPPYREPSVVRRAQSFFDLPPELRFQIYELLFGDSAQLRLLTDIAAVRVRQGSEVSDTRIRRNFTRNGRANRRHVFSYQEWVDERPNAVDRLRPWEREVASITYETAADDDVLARLPQEGERFALLRASRQFNQDAGSFLYSRRFRFSHPREQNILPEDDGIYHGILAANAFFTNRSTLGREQFSEIELDLTPGPPLRDPPQAGRAPSSRTMNPPNSIGEHNFLNGLDNLEDLSNTLRGMPFQHLSLNFSGRGPNWRRRRITDPRQEVTDYDMPIYPWTLSLFNIGRRRRLRLQVRFLFSATPNPELARRDPNGALEAHNGPLFDTMYMIRVIRNHLLMNAQLLEDQYQGIRVLAWEFDPMGESYIDREVLIECDDEYIPERNAIESRLEERTFGDGPGQWLQPYYDYWVTDDPPRDLPPPPPAPARQEPQSTGRQRPPPEEEERSILD